jgi:hypothetical protein
MMTLINCSERYVTIGNEVADFSGKFRKVPLRIATLLSAHCFSAFM